MCGIAGICDFNNSQPISPELIKRMIGAIKHRGPDESGIYLDDWVGLGQARLSIIDLSSGSQPIHNEDETLWIIFNGEIFNYLELKQDLLLKGHRFYTSTDTEVILHLYEETGADCLSDLNGQFAFAIWDTREKVLFLARDRVGILPLHYTLQEGRIIFASEIKSIFMDEDVTRKIDPIALDQIFTFWTTLPGRTAFKGIYELPPGHFLKVSDRRVSIQKYWELPFSLPREQLDLPLEDICSKLIELLKDSIRIRLRAEVPVGCYLSGGLDSSGLTALVRMDFNHALRTFGIQFEEDGFDESRFQENIVSFLGVDHTGIQMRNEQIASFFPDALWHCEKPLLRTAPVPLFILSEAVRQNRFKVVLTGEGADEVFGGYNIFREAKVRRFWAKKPDSKLRPLLVNRLYPYVFANHTKIRPFIQTFFGRDLDRTEDLLFSHLLRWQNSSRTKTFFSNDLREKIGSYTGYDELRQSLPETFEDWDDLSRAQYLEMSLFMSNYLLSAQGDRVAMAHGVEVRPPYLDHRIIDFMGKVSSKWKIRGLKEKYVLKKAFQKILPDQILTRPKHPYRAPISQGLLNHSSPLIEELLSDRALKESRLFDPVKVRRLFNKLDMAQQVSEVDSMALAGIVSSQIVYDQFIAHFPFKSVQPIVPNLLVDKRSIGIK
jgi:asparagine synthase (glutamine-hydrolysing)